ncbi:MAG TPA: Rieske 2Fe-2S domain-containing protein [Candidatus Binataceae bacterium]|nr:Rieske 2Fe-2S domain-containing protein [Candidatus Binataceae bacterium]
MLTREENELICRVGPGSAMGEYLREHWVPAMRAASLQPDGAPMRVRLFGENFVVFRATDGRVGFFDEGCPHRCTSLALARNEDNALTCIFHGWKIDVSGKVVDVPSEPPERRAEFATKVRVRHYPVREGAAMVWVYLGKRTLPPEFPNFEFNQLPAQNCRPMRALLHCNWFQGMEAVLDAAHVGVLHRSNIPNMGDEIKLASRNTGPVFELLMRPYGFREGALRDLGDGTFYARIREVVLPFFSFIPNDPPMPNLMICAIPIDDEWNAQWYVWYNPQGGIDDAVILRILGNHAQNDDNFCEDMGSLDNFWHQDRLRMKEGHWTGVRCFAYEDFVVEEAMGPICDRTKEYLGSSDTIIIRVRRLLLNGLRQFQQTGRLSYGMEEGFDYSHVRAIGIRYRKELDWREIDSFNPPARLQAD